MLQRENAVLTFIDVQGTLADSVSGRDDLMDNLERLLKGLKLLRVPCIWTEQMPEKLGPTCKRFSDMLDDGLPVRKSTFSCWGEKKYRSHLEQSGRRQVLLCGIETHVCVCQTALELLASNYEVYVVADAVSSRRPASSDIGLRRMMQAGVVPVTTESVLLELLTDARDPLMRDIVKLIK